MDLLGQNAKSKRTNPPEQSYRLLKGLDAVREERISRTSHPAVRHVEYIRLNLDCKGPCLENIHCFISRLVLRSFRWEKHAWLPTTRSAAQLF